MSAQNPYVVIGCSAAGLAAVQKIRMLDADAPILCIAQEREFPYNKCFLVDVLSGAKMMEHVHTKPISFFKEHRIELLLNKQVISLDRDQKMITCLDGSHYEYRSLLLATGARSRQFSQRGQGVFSFYTLSDMIAIKEWMVRRAVKRVVVLGAGLTGLEVVDALQKFNLSITVIEQQDTILKRHIDTEGATFLFDRIKKYKNIFVYTNMSVKEIIFVHGVVASVVCEEGIEIPADMVITALGSIPNNELAVQTNLLCESGGVMTNHFLQTTDVSIFAAGDVALVQNIFTGKKERSGLWADAIQQGNHAAHAMVGRPKNYFGIMPITASSFFGVSFYSAGILEVAEPRYSVRIDRSQGYEKVITDKSGTIIGFILIGAEFKNLIAYKRSLIMGKPI